MILKVEPLPFYIAKLLFEKRVVFPASSTLQMRNATFTQ